MDSSDTGSIDDLMAEAAVLYPGVAVGRPAQARAFRPLVVVMHALRLALRIEASGVDQVAPGAAILIGNHTSALDPFCVVVATGWRVSAFTKIEAFEGSARILFRNMGQIALRRGDEDSTRWAMQAARLTLASGWKIGLYPEGTRTPVPGTLHRLHKRILIPLLRGNPGVAVHAVTLRYERRSRLRRVRVHIRISPPLDLQVAASTAEELTELIKDALIRTGDLAYDDRYAQEVKARQRDVRAVGL